MVIKNKKGGKLKNETVVVLDFGGQYNQLIARRVRECNVYCEIYSYKTDIEKIKEEIEHRKIVVRKEALEDVKVARAQGDLSENFEYKAAKQFKNKKSNDLHAERAEPTFQTKLNIERLQL